MLQRCHRYRDSTLRLELHNMIDRVFFLGLFLFLLGTGMLVYVFRYIWAIVRRPRVPGVVSKTRAATNGGGPNRSRTSSHYAEVSYRFNDQDYTVEVSTGSGAMLHHNEGQSVAVAVNVDRPEKGVVISGQMLFLRGFVSVFGVGLAMAGGGILLVKLGLLTADAA